MSQPKAHRRTAILQERQARQVSTRRRPSGPDGSPRPKSVIKAEVIEAQVEEIITSVKLPDSWREVVTYYLGLVEERERAGQERQRLQEHLRRLQQLFLDGYPDSEYRREKEAIEAALRAVSAPNDDEVFVQGDNIEGLIEAWSRATREEKKEILQMIFHAVYVDTSSGKVVALDVKPSFKPLFRAWIEAEGTNGPAIGSGRLCMATPRGIGVARRKIPLLRSVHSVED